MSATINMLEQNSFPLAWKETEAGPDSKSPNIYQLHLQVWKGKGYSGVMWQFENVFFFSFIHLPPTHYRFLDWR